MAFDGTKAPFPWFGGKSQAGPAVWKALGDVDHYVEPFAGSMAVLLNRPHEVNRTYFSETVNDLDGFVVNAWRAIQLHPDATADAASNPVMEADLIARHLALVRWRAEKNLELLMGDPAWCDPLMAGWWLWGVACWIGGGWCDGKGPWTTDANGRIYKQGKLKPRANGVSNRLPHLSDNGQGVNAPQLREPGVSNQLPHLSDDGRGVNAPQLREPGTAFHPVTMPKLRAWFGHLSARLRHVRILNGDWRRAVTTGATHTITVRRGDGHAGIFLDPPYSTEAGRDMGLYSNDSGDVAHEVRAWCLENGDNPKNRIVLAGFEGEHEELAAHGWRPIGWFKAGFLKGGMAQLGSDGHQQDRERLWLSPHCLGAAKDDGQRLMFADDEAAEYVEMV